MLDTYPTSGDDFNLSRMLQPAKSSTRQRPREPKLTTQTVNFDLVAKQVNVYRSSPVRCVALYFLADGGKGWNNVIDFAMIVFGRMLRLRCRVLYGTFSDRIVYMRCLMVFTIPKCDCVTFARIFSCPKCWCFLLRYLFSSGSRKIQSEKGSKQECKYNLMCLGFTPTSMPKELDDEEDDDMGGSNSKKRKVRNVKDAER